MFRVACASYEAFSALHKLLCGAWLFSYIYKVRERDVCTLNLHTSGITCCTTKTVVLIFAYLDDPLLLIILFTLYETTWSDLILIFSDLIWAKKWNYYAQNFLCHCQLSFPQVQVCRMHLVFSWRCLFSFKWIHGKVPYYTWYLQQAGYLWGFSPGRRALLGCQRAECSSLSSGCFPADLDRHWIRIIP